MNEDKGNDTSVSTTDEKTKDKKPDLVSVSELFSFAKTRKVWIFIIAAFCCSLVSGAVLPVMAFYFATAFEKLAASTENDDFLKTIREVCYAFMILGAVILCAMTAQATLMETAAGEMTNELKTSWFKALLRQDMAYFDIKDASGEATIISINGAKYRKGIGRKLAESVQFFATFAGAIAYSFYASWRTSLVVMAVAPLMYITVLFMVKINTSQTARASATYAKAGSIANTAVSAIRTILSLNAVEKMIELYKAATQEAYDGAVSQVLLLGMANGSNMAAFLLSYVVVDLFGAYLLYDNVRDSGCDPSGTVPGTETCDPSGVDIFGALFGITIAASILPQVSVAIEAFVGARAACYPAFAAMHRTTEEDSEEGSSDHGRNGTDVTSTFRRGDSALPKYVIDSSSEKGKRLSTVTGEIEFRDVQFAFPTRQETDVFREFSLKIAAGKTVALVGPSGSGKSSATQLLERFYDPQGGSVTLDGVDLKDLNVKWLRQQIGLVSQEPKLFVGSIRDNIAVAAPDATQQEIENAAKMANAHDFIQSFPKGYDTEVGDMGAQLSGGQKQRIAIARVLVRNVKILLLDEATSALDSESEAVVQQALDKLMKLESMTTLVIAHRLSTIKNADMIAVLSEGKVVETGSHEELLGMGGHYFRLVEAQKMKISDSTPSSVHGGMAESTADSSSEHNGRRESTLEQSVHSESGSTPIFRFRDVHFHYPARPDSEVFRGLNLNVRHGETLALVGPSGCGKSSVIQLMECFYRPTEGCIEYNGVDMKELNVRWLRDQLGLVSQEPILFDTTIEENIRYSCEASREQIEDAAKMANAHDFIMSFPEGYETQVGQGSTLVSGGQKQRIALARALLKRPKVLLLDEATSALDSESEAVVQKALDKVMFDEDQTCVVIAHRLSTIRNADRIAVIDHGKVREIGSHDELMAKNGRYAKLQALQSLAAIDHATLPQDDEHDREAKAASPKEDSKVTAVADEVETEEIDVRAATKKTQLLAASDRRYFLVGGIGAVLAGLIFPAWGFVFAYMIELIYTPNDCPEGDIDCWDSIADDMQERSLKIFYGYLGVLASTMIGFSLLFWGFGTASERMNKRVRDAAFTSLLRQEVGWFDLRTPGTITSRLADDAAMLHAFAGEPIRTLVLNVSSVVVGVVVSFIYMWPFALLTLAIIPFMAFGAEMEMAMYMGEDEGDIEDIDENSSGGIVIETLSNIRTVASLTLEEKRAADYTKALEREDPHPIKTNMLKGSAAGTGQFVQMYSFALMFFWGGWLLVNYPNKFSYREYLISMFSLFFSLYGLTLAAQGAVNREKAKQAAARIFELTDRQSLIDPLSDSGTKDV